MQNMKRVLSLLIALMMLMSVMCLSAFADEAEDDVGNSSTPLATDSNTEGTDDSEEGTSDFDADDEDVTVYVAQIGDKRYETLAEAVANAKNNETVELLSDSSGSGVKIKTANAKDITIDFGGHIYTVVEDLVGSTGYESQGFHFEKGCTITLKNGEVQSSSAKMLIQNYSNLTLEDITVGSSDGKYGYTLSNNNGTITIGSGTTINAKDGGYAFDVCATTHYPDGAQVTVKDGATINGTIQYGVWTRIPIDNKATLTIEGGTINGTFEIESALSEAAKTNFRVTGGTFSDSDTATAYKVTGSNLIVVKNEDGSYTVRTVALVDNATVGSVSTIRNRTGTLTGEAGVENTWSTDSDIISVDAQTGAVSLIGTVTESTTAEVTVTFSGVDGEEYTRTVSVTIIADPVTQEPIVVIEQPVSNDDAGDTGYSDEELAAVAQAIAEVTGTTVVTPVTIEDEATPLAQLPENLAETTADAAAFAREIGLTLDEDSADEAAAAETISTVVAAVIGDAADVAAALEEAGITGSEEVSREQLVVALYTLAANMGFDVSAAADLSAFNDAGELSDVAVAAMQWAVEIGLIKGNGAGLDSAGVLTQEQLLIIMARFAALVQ